MPALPALLPVFNVLPGAYLLLSPDLTIEAASDEYLAATLTRRESLLGRYLFDAFPDNPQAPEAHAGRNLRASLAQVLATGQPHKMARQHYDVPDPDAPGQFVERYWLPHNTPVLDEQGQVCQIIHAVINVTEQVQAKRGSRESQAREQVARAAAELQRVRLQQVFEQAPVAIAICRGPALVVEVANPKILELWGKTREEALDKPLFEALPEVRGQGYEALFEGVLRTGTPVVAQELPATLLRFGRVETPSFNFNYQPLRDEQGQITGVIIVAAEVTEQVAARQQVQTLNEELAAANEELQAANEEFLTNNAELAQIQLLLRQLNLELEARVAERTQEAQAAQAEAERQRARLERFFRQAPAAICILDGPELVYELVNSSYQQLFPGRALVGKPLLEALPELTGHAVWNTLQRVYQTGRTHEEPSILIPVARHEGAPLEDRYFNYIQQARYDEQGRIDGVLVFAFEVTAQVRAHRQADALQAEVLAGAQRLAQERDTFYQVFEQTPAAICVQRGPEHRYEYYNAAYQQFFPDRQLQDRPVVEAFPEIVPAGILALLDNVYQTGQTYFGHEMPLIIEQPDGSPPKTTFFTFTYQAYRENGQIVGISTFAYDVTEQVLARQQRDAQQVQLRELFEQAPVAIAIFQGPEYIIEVANPPMATLWGRTPAQVVGQPLFEALPEVRDQGFKELLDQVVQTGEAFAAQEVAALLERRGKLETVYLNFVYQPLHDAQGRVTSVAAVATEVSGQVAARQQVQRLNEELRAKNTELGATNQQLVRTNVDLDNFIYTASHDLKAPISNIESLLHALFDELPVASRPEEATHLLRMMQGSVERFKRTIEHLTDVSRLQKEHGQAPGPVQLAAVVEDVRLDLLPLIAEAGAQLDVDVQDCPMLIFSEKNLRSVVYNLLSNALKYRSPERVPLVRLRCRSEEHYWVLEVQDNGLGLDLTRERQLFQMFQRYHTHVEGSGIGLYMIKKMVENAGGRIEVQSQLGQGSTFSVYFPR